MGLLDEWNKVKSNENNKAEAKKFALTQGAPNTQKSYFKSDGKSNVNPGIMNNGLTQASNAAPSPTSLPADWLSRTKQTQDDIPESTYRDGPGLMDQLMARINGQYQPIMPGGQEGASQANNDIMTRLTGQLDSALAARLGAIGNVRNQAQEGYNTSDKNLAAMFAANANHIASQGSARFGQIANDQRASITGARDESLNRLSADRDASMAKRQAMLQALGIEAAGAQADPGDQTLNDAMTGITNRSNTAMQGANQAEGTNQAYNQSVVNSVNQQGTERRAALLQQLQQIQNQLGMAEAEAQEQNVNGKNQLEIQRMQAEAEAQGQSFDDMNKFGYQQFKDDRGLAFDLYKTLLGQQGAEEQAPKVQGYAGLAQDLINQGVPQDQAAQYMGALSQVIGSEYMQGIHPDEGYDRASIISRRLQEMRIPPAIASNLAANYANLGNNAYYQGQ